MSNFHERIGSLTPERRTLLERHFLKKRNDRSIKKQGICRRGTTDPCALSFGQQRLWFLEQLEPGSSAYNMPLAIRLTGRLKVAGLQQSLGEAPRRDARVLCLHQSIEGATCGPPPGFTFRDADDVVRASDLPVDVAAVLCGHVHRHQVLRRDLRGRPLAAPVVYAGSVERTSFAERDETKGFVMATVGRGGPGGRLLACELVPLPARPMRVHEVADGSPASDLEGEIRAAVAAAPPDVVLQVRVPEALAGAEALRAARLGALGPATANVTISVRFPARVG